MAVLRDYSDDEIDAELRRLRRSHPANFSRHAKINLTHNYYYAPSRGEAEMQRAQENLEMLRRGSNEAVIQEMAANTGMEVELLRAFLAWSNDTLKAELTRRNCASMLMLVKPN